MHFKKINLIKNLARLIKSYITLYSRNEIIITVTTKNLITNKLIILIYFFPYKVKIN